MKEFFTRNEASVGGHMSTSVYFGSGPLWQRFFDFTVAMLFFAFLGALSGTMFIRWRGNGLLLAAAVTARLLLGSAALITLTETWPVIGEWFVASRTGSLCGRSSQRRSPPSPATSS
jgi:hypothetical protein